MTRAIMAKVLDVAASVTERDVDALSPDLSLFGDLGLDSAGVLEFVVGLEDAFDIYIGSEDAAGVETLTDVATLVKRLIDAKAG